VFKIQLTHYRDTAEVKHSNSLTCLTNSTFVFNINGKTLYLIETAPKCNKPNYLQWN